MNIVSESTYIALETIKFDIDTYVAKNEIFVPGTEALNIFMSLTDGILRILNNFKTTLLKKFVTGFKRSELTELRQSNTLKFKALLNLPMANMEKIIVPLSENQSASHLEAARMLNSLFSNLNFESSIDNLEVLLGKLTKLYPEDYSKMTTDIKVAVTFMNNVNKDDVTKEIKNCFSNPGRATKVPASVAFGSITDLYKVVDQISRFEYHFKSGVDSVNKVARLERTIGGIVTNIKRSDNIDTAFLQAFYALVYSAAVNIDLYGTALGYAQKVEHNAVMGMRTLMSELL